MQLDLTAQGCERAWMRVECTGCSERLEMQAQPGSLAVTAFLQSDAAGNLCVLGETSIHLLAVECCQLCIHILQSAVGRH